MTRDTAQPRTPALGTGRAVPVLAVAALLVIAAALAFRARGPGGASSPASQPTASNLHVVVSGDTHGWITPCGCTANQSGGLLRRATYLADLRRNGEVIYLDAGGAPAGTSPYQRVKFEAILAGERRMGLAVHNIGGPEAALGADYLRDLQKKGVVQFVSANVRDSGGNPLVTPPLTVVQTAGLRVAVTGVLSPRFATAGLRVDEPRASVLATVAPRRGDYDALVVLAYLPEGELESFAASLPEADAVVGGPTGQAMAPRRNGPGLLAAATNKGKFLVELTAPKRDGGAGGAGPGWSGRIVEAGPSLADEPGQVENLKQYLATLADRDFAAAETGLVAPLAPGAPPDYRVAGSASCLACHKDGGTTWEHSKHAHGLETLKAKGFHVDPTCLQCHTTGYGLPGGFDSVRRSAAALGGVGCENCHGPAKAHVADPKVKTPFAARDQCARCHDPENSPTFAYDPYWQRIRHAIDVRSARAAPAPGASAVEAKSVD
jgi:hypothetical protein